MPQCASHSRGTQCIRGNVKFSLRKIGRRTLTSNSPDGIKRSAERTPPKIQNSIIFLVILALAIIWYSFVAVVPRTIAFGVLGLLFVGLLSQAQAQATSSVTLAWNPSPSSGVAGYRLYYGTSNGNYPLILNVGNTTSATLSGLTPGQRYYLVVTAYNTIGFESLPSNQISFTISATGSPFNIISTSYADLVWENTITGERSIWIMQNGVFSSSINLPTIPTEWHIAAAADFLGTGQAGLVWENKITGERSIWILNNGVLSSTINLPTIPTEWHIAAAADFLGTGQADLVWENTITGEHCIWVMQNGVLSSMINLPTIPIQWRIAAAADFLGTGQADLVWENTITGQRSIWILNNGVLSSTINLPTIPTEWQIVE
jgi:hypothetical protein